MKTHARTGLRVALSTAGGLLIATSIFAVNARADVWNKKTILSVSQPIQVENTYLEPGTYVFKLLDSSSNRHIVQIYNQDEDRVVNTVIAIPNYRLQPSGDTRFSFYETPPGTAKAMRAWFYPGDNYGQEFRYPRELRQIAMAVAPQLQRAPEPTPAPIVTEAAAPEDSSRGPQASVEEPAREPEPAPAEEPAPQAATPAPAPEQPKAEEPEKLPTTATAFPLIGLSGLLSLAGYGALRLRRSQ
jgi:hypothetical protein